GLSLAAVVLFWLALIPFAENAWLTEANYVNTVRGCSLAAIGLLWLVLSLASNPWQTRARRRRAGFQRVCVVPSLAALPGLWVIAVPINPEFGLVVMVMGCLAYPALHQRKARRTLVARHEAEAGSA